jgi:hydrogenase maturation protease
MAGRKESVMLEYQPHRKVVLGLGNLLLGDEGFGIHAMQYMEEQCADRYPVEWVDGGVLGLNLLPLVEDCSHLLVLDIVDAGKPSGTVLELARSNIPVYHGIKLSEHQVGFQEVLAVARFREHYPTFLHLVGVQPADFSLGVELSTQVKAALPEAAWRARDILQCWFFLEDWLNENNRLSDMIQEQA